MLLIILKLLSEPVSSHMSKYSFKFYVINSLKRKTGQSQNNFAAFYFIP